MTTDTDIVNGALRRLGAGRISSLTDGSTNAERASDLYSDILDDMLASHPWNFATSRAKLARSATTPTFEFDYAYVLPSDWLRTVSVHDNDEGVSSVFFREEIVDNQSVLLADVEDVYIRYIYRETNPNRFSADFRMAFQRELAASLAIAVTGSNTLEDQLRKQAERLLARAKSKDAQGSYPEQRPRGSWVTARGGWRTGTDWLR